MEGRADISGGVGLIFLEGRNLWRGGCLRFVEGRADISGGEG